jgi:hypothetical protein
MGQQQYFGIYTIPPFERLHETAKRSFELCTANLARHQIVLQGCRRTDVRAAGDMRDLFLPLKAFWVEILVKPPQSSAIRYSSR